MSEEPFVSANEAARFLGIKRRLLTACAREGLGGAYALDPAKKRKIWLFRLSEIAASIAVKNYNGPRQSPLK